jgi:penicillin-binding protein 1A
MERVVEEGSLSIGAGWGSKFTYRDDYGSYKLPVAGKTGTTQNWSDAWVVGYSPYYTTAVWFGFDRPGNSLGVDLTGATLAGPVWGAFFREIHRGLPRRSFNRPSSGVIDVSVCAASGLLRTSSCNEGEATLPFLEGTQPSQYCHLHEGSSPFPTRMPSAAGRFGGFDEASFIDSLPMPQLQLDLFPELQQSNTQQRQTTRTPATRGNTTTTTRNQPAASTTNPFLDDTPASNNPGGNRQNEPLAFPEAVNQYVPDREDELDDYEDDLPLWNPVR